MATCSGQNLTISLDDLGLSHLNEVEETLTSNSFPRVKWRSLGLKLGLYYNTLDEIATKNREIPLDCLCECLSMWLKGADNCLQTGPISWETLAAVLKKIQEVKVAEKIEELVKELKYPLCQVLQKFQERLALVQLPFKLLCTEKLIECQKLVRYDINDEVLIVGDLFKELRNGVYKDHNKLLLLVRILQLQGSFELAQDILKDYNQAMSQESHIRISSCSRSSSSIVVSPDSGILEINLPPTEQVEFDKIQQSLGSLLHRVAPLIEASVTSINDLKKFLGRCDPDIKGLLKQAVSFDDVFDIVENKCSIINITIIAKLVDEYSVEEAKSHISTYEEELQEFCDVKICNVQLQKYPVALLSCETIKFILDWEVSKCTLQRIKGLLCKAFHNFNKKVEVITINEVNSVAIICYAPCHWIEILLMEVEANIDILKDMGLLKLTAGYYTVYDKYTRDSEVSALEEKLHAVEEELKSAKDSLSKAPFSKDEMINEEKLTISKQRHKGMIMEIEQLQSKLKERNFESEKEIELLQDKLSLQGTKLIEQNELIKEIELKMKVQKLSADIEDMQIQCAQDKLLSANVISSIYSSLTRLFVPVPEIIQGKFESGRLDNGKLYLTSPSPSECVNILPYLLDEATDCENVNISFASSDSALLLFSQLSNKNLRKITIRSTPLTTECIYCLCQVIYRNCLEGLSLRDASLTSESVLLLTNAIMSNTSLVVLEILDENSLSDSAASYISKMIIVNSTLQRLQLKDCNITDIGLEQLVNSIMQNTTLNSFDVSFNAFITSKSTDILCNLISNHHTSLTHIYLHRISLTFESISKLLEALVINENIMELAVDKKYMSDCWKYFTYYLVQHRVTFW